MTQSERDKRWYQKNKKKIKKKRRVYQKKYDKIYYQTHKTEIVARIEERMRRADGIILQAKSKGCCKCGEKDARCLEFHHPHDNKNGQISAMRNANENRLREEITKCIILCANCHKKHHYKIPARYK